MVVKTNQRAASANTGEIMINKTMIQDHPVRIFTGKLNHAKSGREQLGAGNEWTLWLVAVILYF